MSKRGAYLGGHTVVGQGSRWFGSDRDVTHTDNSPTSKALDNMLPGILGTSLGRQTLTKAASVTKEKPTIEQRSRKLRRAKEIRKAVLADEKAKSERKLP